MHAVVRRLAVLGLLGAALVGCSDDEPTGTASSSSSSTGAGDRPELSVADHCAGRVQEDTDVTLTELQGDGLTLVAAEFASPSPSGTALVLLHQTGTLGLCGWSRWAPEAAAAGLPSVAIDMCGYGGSQCADGEATPPGDQVALAAAHAREELAAERVVLVGASMGGSQTVLAVADGAEVDGWADVSGPDVWADTTLLDRAGEVRVRGLPGLVVHSPDDDPAWYAGAQELATATGATFLEGDSGHGWDVLTDTMGGLRPDGQAVIDFALSVG